MPKARVALLYTCQFRRDFRCALERGNNDLLFIINRETTQFTRARSKTATFDRQLKSLRADKGALPQITRAHKNATSRTRGALNPDHEATITRLMTRRKGREEETLQGVRTARVLGGVNFKATLERVRATHAAIRTSTVDVVRAEKSVESRWEGRGHKGEPLRMRAS